jgi:5-methylcytosine-specific restriction endonuclease McrA
MKKTFLVLAAFVLLITVSFSFTSKDDPLYKNLKVLPKNITKEQMDSVMHHFSLSLGVRCNYCHMRNDETKKWDFASDENKHKLVARNMMEMTDKINDKFFNVTGGKKNLNAQLMVTCFTCHHGSTDPATQPVMAHNEQKPPNKTDSTRKQ